MLIPEGNRSTLRISILWHATLLCKDHRCLKQHVYPQALPKKGRRPPYALPVMAKYRSKIEKIITY